MDDSPTDVLNVANTFERKPEQHDPKQWQTPMTSVGFVAKKPHQKPKKQPISCYPLTSYFSQNRQCDWKRRKGKPQHEIWKLNYTWRILKTAFSSIFFLLLFLRAMENEKSFTFYDSEIEKAKWEALNFPSPSQDRNNKQYHILGNGEGGVQFVKDL